MNTGSPKDDSQLSAITAAVVPNGLSKARIQVREQGLFLFAQRVAALLSRGARDRLLGARLRTSGFRIGRAPKLRGVDRIAVGSSFSGGDYIWIEAVTRYAGHTYTPQIAIGSNVTISDNVHIGATCSVRIGDGALVGSRVTIIDHNHGVYDGADQTSPLVPPAERRLSSDKTIEVGKNVWLGEGVVVLPGARIGEGSIIGANSVVNGSIPPYCIAVGAPARLVRTYDFDSREWVKMQTPHVSGACTIVSPNYLPFARTLARSYQVQHPGEPFFVLVVARDMNRSQFRDEPFTAVLLEDIGLESLAALAMKYAILELNTNVKPRFMLHLLRQHDLASLIYLDPDIFVYAPLEPIRELLRDNAAVLTPHLTSPTDEKTGGGLEQEVLYNGTYNLGFIAVKQCHETTRLLEWWDARCIHNGFNEGRSGLFVDQKWMNLAPSLFDGVVACKHPGCNMGFWNLHERRLGVEAGSFRVNNEHALCFYHFSGVQVDRRDVLSKNTSLYTLASRPDLKEIFASYKQTVIANRVRHLDELPYGFDTFRDGTAVTLLARRLFAAHESSFAGEDPFAVGSKFSRFARRHGLVAGRAQPAKVGWNDMAKQDKRVRAIQSMLRLGLKVLGPNRYELLMRYLSFISILRNQAEFIKD